MSVDVSPVSYSDSETVRVLDTPAKSTSKEEVGFTGVCIIFIVWLIETVRASTNSVCSEQKYSQQVSFNKIKSIFRSTKIALYNKGKLTL